MLREDLQMTGTKHGCGIGACGTCTVMVDGYPIASCLQLAALVDGAEIRTVEGLAGASSLHPVQQAFVNRSALQCGICMPGHIMAACALLEKTRDPRTSRSAPASTASTAAAPATSASPKPTRKRSRSRAKRRRHEPARSPTCVAPASLLVVGKDVPRTDAIPKVTGAAQYVADLHFPGMLHAAVLRSPHPHARIVSIDTSAAAALPGVKAVVTGADTAQRKWGCFRPDLYPLAIDKVRYVGDEVAAVAATDPETARAAVDQIKVEYEVLPAVLSLDEALAPGAPLVHDDAAGNVAHHFAFERGDVDAGFKASDVMVEGTWESARQWHTSLETIGCVAQWTGDRVSMWCNTQTPFLARGRYAVALGVPESQVRVDPDRSRRRFRRQVRRRQCVGDLRAARAQGGQAGQAHPYPRRGISREPPAHADALLGAARVSAATAASWQKKSRCSPDNGAYTGKSQAILGAATRAPRCALQVSLRARGFDARLHEPGANRRVPRFRQSFRGLGGGAGVGPRRGKTRHRRRRPAAHERGGTRRRSPHNHKITSCELKQCIDKAAQMIGWKEKRKHRTPNRGLGIGCSVHVNGRRSFGDWDGSSAIVRINDDGRATIITGEGEIGQGTLTVLRQIAAEELGLPLRGRGHHASRHRRTTLCARRAGEPPDLRGGQRGQERRRGGGIEAVARSGGGAVQAARRKS